MTRQDYRMPLSKCSECGWELNGATETLAEGQKPRPGNLAVCINCAAVLCFDDELQLRASTLAERSEGGPELEQAVRVVLAINGGKRRTR